MFVNRKYIICTLFGVLWHLHYQLFETEIITFKARTLAFSNSSSNMLITGTVKTTHFAHPNVFIGDHVSPQRCVYHIQSCYGKVYLRMNTFLFM